MDSVWPLNELSTQANETKEEQVPENTSKTASNDAEPITDKECEVAVATNLYQPSSSALPTQPAIFCVKPAVDPETGEQPAVTAKEIAPEQLSDWANEFEKQQRAINKL